VAVVQVSESSDRLAAAQANSAAAKAEYAAILARKGRKPKHHYTPKEAVTAVMALALVLCVIAAVALNSGSAPTQPNCGQCKVFNGQESVQQYQSGK
jgi:hypothetical protein